MYILISTSRMSEQKVPIAFVALQFLDISNSDNAFGFGRILVFLKFLI